MGTRILILELWSKYKAYMEGQSIHSVSSAGWNTNMPDTDPDKQERLLEQYGVRLKLREEYLDLPIIYI